MFATGRPAQTRSLLCWGSWIFAASSRLLHQSRTSRWCSWYYHRRASFFGMLALFLEYQRSVSNTPPGSRVTYELGKRVCSTGRWAAIHTSHPLSSTRRSDARLHAFHLHAAIPERLRTVRFLDWFTYFWITFLLDWIMIDFVLVPVPAYALWWSWRTK